jgi:peptidoglycan/LPS O-acetylase OafA/YrhL
VAPASNEAQPTKTRAYYSDWIRATAISLVIFVHCLGLSFDSTGYNVKAGWEMAREKRDGVFKCLVQIGIPMFFYISGIGTTYYKTEKKNAYCLFVWNKVTRIMFPFIVACFVFLIPRLYLGQDFENFTRPQGVITKNIGEFYIKTIKYNLVTNLSWLWYLPAMFVDFLLTYPLLRWSKRRKAGMPIEKDDALIFLLLLVTMGGWAAVNYLALPQYAHLLVPSIVVLTASQLVYMFS